jgi:6-pyruvoyltetrahydropterin/6-carboxytetrahydropterin synthase
VERYDHTNLNLLDDFRDLVPTTENLCIRAYQRIKNAFHDAELIRVRIEETSNNFFEYAGEGN